MSDLSKEFPPKKDITADRISRPYSDLISNPEITKYFPKKTLEKPKPSERVGVRSEYARDLESQEYGAQLRALLETGIEDSFTTENNVFQIKEDDFGTHSIRFMDEFFLPGMSSGLCSYPVFEITVSNQGRLRIGSYGSFDTAKSNLRFNAQKMDWEWPSMGEHEIQLNNFTGTPDECKQVDRVIQKLQTELVEKLASDDGKELDLETVSIKPNPTDHSERFRYFAQACQQYPDAMRDAHLPLLAGLLPPDIKPVADAARIEDLVEGGIANLPMLNRGRINLKGGLKIQRVDQAFFPHIEVAFPSK